MFNKTIHKHESKVVAVTKEIEKTITPDKVTEMYDAVREEVEKSVVRSILVSDNSLHGAVVEIHPKYEDATSVILLRLTLNGKEHMEREAIPRDQAMSESDLFEKLRDFYIRVVSTEVIKQTIDVIPRTLRGTKFSR